MYEYIYFVQFSFKRVGQRDPKVFKIALVFHLHKPRNNFIGLYFPRITCLNQISHKPEPNKSPRSARLCRCVRFHAFLDYLIRHTHSLCIEHRG